MKHKCFRRILVAVDPVLVGDSHDTLNSLLLELASTLAELESAELHIVHAWRLVGESMMRGRFAIPEADIDNAAKLEFERRRGLLEGVLRKHSITSNQVHLPKGDPIPAITDLVKDLEVDLLVMGTVCRTGIPGFIIGNTAEQILAKVECSTLTVKPLGFVSPVTL
jgi:nucleotide-binding universal stress UspA family protein